jgi:error-prone DNA polymerase
MSFLACQAAITPLLPMNSAYVELHCTTNFSFLCGASHPEELVQRALALEYSGLAITDECSFAGSARAHLRWQELAQRDAPACGFRLIHGTEIALTDGGPRLVLLAVSRKGYGDLSQLVTLARRQACKGEYRLTMADVEAHLPWLDDCLALLVPDCSARRPHPSPAPQAGAGERSMDTACSLAIRHARWLAEVAPGRAWLACELLRGPDDAAQLSTLRAVAQVSGLPLVAAGNVQMHLRSRKRLLDVLAAIRHNRPLAQMGRELAPNAEQYLRPLYRLERIYPPELLRETLVISEQCQFNLGELRYEYPHEIVPASHTPSSWLRQLTYEGAQRHYPAGIPDHVRATLEGELALIAQLKYEPFFLTVYDIVRFAREQNILCQGRGSAANSAVCYCLGITAVDPDRASLLFERFISAERNEPPDIDVDFEHQRREEVMQYVYAKYGRHRAALTAALHTYHPRGALRDVGRALGLSLDQVDKLAKSMAWWDGKRIAPERLREAGFDPDNPTIAQLAELAQQLLGFPRHLSQHSGGFVIARERLDRLVPIENAAMPERTVIQWDKNDLDALGLLKVDVLALGMLTCIRRALDHVNGFRSKGEADAAVAQSCGALPSPGASRHPLPLMWERVVCPRPHEGEESEPERERDGGEGGALRAGPRAPLTLATLPPEDPAVYDMLCRGDSLGVFQVESRAQMNMLPRLAPRRFYDLVIQVAIVRPGPIQGGMVHPFLRRRQGLEPVSYPSAAVEGVLKRTLGVSIFQEQVMQLAVVAAGFTPGEADQLRRAMAAWKRKGGIGPFRSKLLDGLRANGYSAEYAEQIYQQIQGFGEYGFPESHAASFALLVYASSWLKCHEPAAFCAALLDSQPLGFYGPAQIVRDAVEHGVEVRPVDATTSDWYCRLDPSTADPARPAVRLGLELVNGFNQAAAQRIVAARTQAPFADIADFAARAQLTRVEINALAAADALAPLAGHRRQALWDTLALDPGAARHAPLAAHTAREAQLELLPPSEGQDIVADYRATALTLRRHPLALLRSRLEGLRLSTAAHVAASRHKQPIRASGIVTCRQRPGTASGVTFVTLEDETGTINVVVWRAVAEKYRRELLSATLLTIYGHVERIDTAHAPVVHLIAQRLVDHSALLGGLTLPSRDFH